MLPSLPCRRCFLPACLMLGALLCTVSASADLPAAPAASSAAAQNIVLQHVVPGDILKFMHWDQAAHLPVGVTQIRVLPADNALSVIATPAGLAEVRKIVKTLDIAPRQVRIASTFAQATEADLNTSGVKFAPDSSALVSATGSAAARFLQTLMKQEAVMQVPVVTTANNVSARISISTPAASQAPAYLTFAVTPRVNSDGSVTLALHSAFSEGTVLHEITLTRTVKNGDTLVIAMPPADAHADRTALLLFVTPTAL